MYRDGQRMKRGLTVVAVFFLCLAVPLSGCGSRKTPKAAKLSPDAHASGDNQCGMYDEVLAKPLKVVVEGPAAPGLLGGKGGRPVVRGAEVTFTILDPASGATFEDTRTAKTVAVTDAGGSASAWVRLGQRPGGVAVQACIETADGVKRVDFRVLNGVEIVGKDLEGPTGATIKDIGIRLVQPDGSPAVGVLVYFEVPGGAHKSSVGGRSLVEVLTDENGHALTSWTLGDMADQYFLIVGIKDKRPEVSESNRFDARVIEMKAMAIDKRKMLFGLIGGLAIFILGMKWMSGGLRRMADRRLKAILQAMARNRLVAVAVGAGFTAVIQSSSATTVMAVGFVNAGLLTLGQAIAVDYGANIGTTVTAQIIAFKLNTLAYPAIALGLIMSSLAKKTWAKSLGESILGFGLLFLGLTLMSDQLGPLKNSPSFRAWFLVFDCSPVNGGMVQAWPAFMCIVIGIVVTMVVQSSSATVGLVLVLASQDLISFYTAVPLVLGDNIGTTVTAWLASLGANRNAKRTAMAHTLFKIFGAVYMYVLLFVPLWKGEPVFLGFVDYITPGDVFASAPQALQRHIANAHTTFNVINVVLFLPCIGLMVRLCQKLIPMTDADQESVLEYLEPHLLDSPSLALQQATSEVAYMVRRAQKSVNEACEVFYGGSRGLEEKILEREELIDRLQHDITEYLVELSRRNLSPQEATLLPALVHAVNDAERIGDHSEDLLEMTHVIRDHELKLSDEAIDAIKALQAILNEQFDATMRSLTEEDASQVERVIEKEDEITQHMARTAEEHMAQLENRDYSVQAGVIYLDFLAHLERVGDRLTNIAERAGRIIQVMSN